MSTQTLGERAAAALKEAKAKRPVSWEEVADIIDGCQKAESGQNKGPGRPGARLAIAEAIYATYPRHVGREAALKAIGKAAERLTDKEDALAYLLERAGLYARAVALWPESERQYCPHPATWFNQGRYNDDPKEWVRSSVEAKVERNYGRI